MGAKTNGIHYEERVDKILELCLAGLSRAQIIKYVTSEEWGISPRTVDNYIAKAKQFFRERAGIDRAALAGRTLARLDDLYARALRIQDFRICLAIVRESNRLLGLDRKWPKVEGD